MRVYVLVGAPGAGKGTQAEILSERLGVPAVASGNLFRAAIREGTPLGRQVAGYLEGGQLVPDSLAIVLIGARLDQPDAREGAILDGFPRTRLQAVALDRDLAARGAAVAQALYIGVREVELRRRLGGRLICRAAGHAYHTTDNPPHTAGRCDLDGSELYQREDDRPATVAARLAAQLPPMYDVVDYYSQQGLLTAVDGEQPIERVTEALLRAIAQPARG